MIGRDPEELQLYNSHVGRGKRVGRDFGISLLFRDRNPGTSCRYSR